MPISSQTTEDGAPVDITVTGIAAPANLAPVANPDSAVVAEDGTVLIDVLANDTDPENDTLTLQSASAANGGSVAIVNGRLRFAPLPDFFGTTTLTYNVTDGQGNVSQGTVTVDVAPVPDAPTAGDDSGVGFETQYDTAFTTGNVLDNDSDPDGDSLTISAVLTSGTHGVVTNNGDGTFDYDPNGAFGELAAGQTAIDTFEYTVTDSTGGTDTATVEILISGTDNVIIGGTTNEPLVGTDGNDLILNGTGQSVITLRDGLDAIHGAPETFFGDRIEGLGTNDRILFEEVELNRDAFGFAPGTLTVVGIDLDGDSAVDGNFTFTGDFSGGEFMVVPNDGNTLLTFETFLPNLIEGQAVAASQINGINNPDYLIGDGSTSYTIRVRNQAEAAFDNVLGVYEVDEDGNIVDVRIVTNDVSENGGDTFTVGGIEDGHALAFFIVQDGAGWADGLVNADELAFVDQDGEAATVYDRDVVLTVNGEATDEIVFHSYAAQLNPDGAQHVLSGVEEGGESIIIGFEDLLNTGDSDFQDVVFSVEM